MPVERDQIVELLQAIYPFRRLTPAELDQVVEKIQPVEYKQGETICDEGEEGYSIYMVFSGKVNLTRGKGDDLEEMATLDVGDHFGLEAVRSGARRLFSAKAAENCILLEFESAQLQEFMQSFPVLRLGVHILHESYHLTSTVNQSWRNPGEAVFYIARRSAFFLWLRLIIPILLAVLTVPLLLFLLLQIPSASTLFGILLGLDILFFAGLIIWNYVDWSNDYSIITNQRVLFQERVILIYESRQEVPLDAVLSEQTTTGFWGRQLDFGDVIVRTYSFSMVLPNVDHPREVIALIEDQVARVKMQFSQAEQERKRKLLEQRREALRQPASRRPRPSAPPAQVKSGTIPNWLNFFLRMHIEHNGALIYRTHWFILIKKLLAPTIVLLLLVVSLVLRLAGLLTTIPLGTALGVLLFFILVVGLWWLYQYADWANDLYIITDEQIIDIYKKPLGTEQRRTAMIKNILSVEFERIGFIGLILNFGTVYLRVGEEEFTFDNVYNPSLVQREIFHRLAEKTRQERQSNRMSQWNDIADFFVLNEGVTEQDVIAAQPLDDEYEPVDDEIEYYEDDEENNEDSDE